MAKKISGLTVAITADTKGVTSGLKDITTESVKATNNLKQVESLLKLDPGNTELLAERQKLLADSISATSKKLEALKAAQADVNREFQAGNISDAEYIAFQRELVQTEKRLNDLKTAEQDAGKSTKDLGKNIDDTDKETSEFADTLKNAVVASAQVAATAIAAIGTAAAAAVTGIIDLANETAKLGDDIDKSSQKLGMSAESYQEWSFIMKHSGSDIDKMTTSMKKLADAATDPSDAVTEAFSKIGMSMDEVAAMSQEDLFAATITALQGMESGAERTAIANDLLGKSAMDLGALLNTSAEDTQAMREQMHELGGVMSDEAVKNAAAYEDSLLNMQTAIDGFKNGIANSFIPSISQVMDGISGIVSGQEDGTDTLIIGLENFVESVGTTVDSMRGKLETIAGTIADAILKSLPDILELGVDIVLGLVDGIVKALPKIAQSAVTIMNKLMDGVLKIMPELMGAGVDVITTLIIGIGKSLPTLIPSAVKAITTLVQGLVDSMPQLIRAALALIQGLADGLLRALPQLLNALPEIINSLVDGLLTEIPTIINTGIQLLTAIVSALPTIISKIVEVLPDIVFGIVDALMDNLPLIINAGFDLLTAIIDNLPEIIAEIVTAIPLILAALWEGFSERFPDMAQWGVDLFKQLIERGDEIMQKIAGLVPQIITKIRTAFMEKYSDLQNMGMRIFENIQTGIQSIMSNAWNWGADLISNFVSGITDNIWQIINAGIDIGNTIRDYIGFSEPEKGPLSDFHTFAPDMMELFAEGIRDSEATLAAQFNRSLAGITSAQPAIQPSMQAAKAPIFNVNVNVGSIASDYDVSRMTDIMISEISQGLAHLQSRQNALLGANN